MPNPEDGEQRSIERRNSASNVPIMLVVAACGICVSVIVGIVVITVLRPEKENLPLIAVLVGFATTTLGTLYAALKATETGAQVQQLKVAVDGRLTQLLEVTKRAERAEGKDEGRIDERDRVPAPTESRNGLQTRQADLVPTAREQLEVQKEIAANTQATAEHTDPDRKQE